MEDRVELKAQLADGEDAAASPEFDATDRKATGSQAQAHVADPDAGDGKDKATGNRGKSTSANMVADDAKPAAGTGKADTGNSPENGKPTASRADSKAGVTTEFAAVTDRTDKGKDDAGREAPKDDGNGLAAKTGDNRDKTLAAESPAAGLPAAGLPAAGLPAAKAAEKTAVSDDANSAGGAGKTSTGSSPTPAPAATNAGTDSVWNKRGQADSTWPETGGKDPIWTKRDNNDPIWPTHADSDSIWPKRDDKESAWPKSPQLPTPPVPRAADTKPAMPVPPKPVPPKPEPARDAGLDWTPSFSSTPPAPSPSGTAIPGPSPTAADPPRVTSSLAALAKKAKLPGGPRTSAGAERLANAARISGAAGLSRAVATKAKPKARPKAAVKSAASQAPGQRRDAQLVLSRIEPWSVMKFSFLISLLGFVVMFVAVSVIYYALSALGIFTKIEQTVGLVTSGIGSQGTNASKWFSASTVLGYTLMAGAIDVILITALLTIGAVIYNLITRISGGIEITLQEAD